MSAIRCLFWGTFFVLCLYLSVEASPLKTDGDQRSPRSPVFYKQTKESVTSLGRTTNRRWLEFKSILYQRVAAPIQRHVVRRLAEGVYTFGRFINDAGRKSLQSLNSALPHVGEPTVICEGMTCSFCTNTVVPSFDFYKQVCLELALRPREMGFGVRLSLDGNTVTEYQVSWKKPSDVRLDLGGFYNVFFRTRLYNNCFKNNTFYTCVSLELDFPFNSVIYLEIGCYYFGTGGAGRWVEDQDSPPKNKTEVNMEHIEERNKTSASQKNKTDVNTTHIEERNKTLASQKNKIEVNTTHNEERIKILSSQENKTDVNTTHMEERNKNLASQNENKVIDMKDEGYEKPKTTKAKRIVEINDRPVDNGRSKTEDSKNHFLQKLAAVKRKLNEVEENCTCDCNIAYREKFDISTVDKDEMELVRFFYRVIEAVYEEDGSRDVIARTGFKDRLTALKVKRNETKSKAISLPTVTISETTKETTPIPAQTYVENGNARNVSEGYEAIAIETQTEINQNSRKPMEQNYTFQNHNHLQHGKNRLHLQKRISSENEVTDAKIFKDENNLKLSEDEEIKENKISRRHASEGRNVDNLNQHIEESAILAGTSEKKLDEMLAEEKDLKETELKYKLVDYITNFVEVISDDDWNMLFQN